MLADVSRPSRRTTDWPAAPPWSSALNGVGSEAKETVTLVVAELAANAVRHGRVRGRGFLVRLVPSEDVVRVEVLDARVDRLPALAPEPDEGGRGLLLVAALAEEWGVELSPDGAHKTVWAELALSPLP